MEPLTQRGAKRCPLALGEFLSERDAPHIGVKRFVIYVDCADAHVHDFLHFHDSPVGILQFIKEAHNIFSTSWRT